jgi:CXXX repeat radical SAM target protein
MKDNDAKNATYAAFPDKKDRIDRRQFLSTAGKLIIPTLGILGLSLTGLSGKALASDCAGSCKGGCAYICGGCDGTCKGGCEGHMFK